MISVIIPVHNEEENVKTLSKELSDTLKKLKEDYEVLFIDDASTDATYDNLRSQKFDKNIKVIQLKKQSGKGQALATGITASVGDKIVFMDGDLQDNPDDLPRLIKKLDEGYDLVNGVRIKRKDRFLIKLYSSIANSILNSFLKSPFKDINSPFKAMKRDIFNEIALYANNFRFFPLAAYYNGFRVVEVEVNNRPRIHGKSKFGIGKVFIGMFDMLTAYFIYRFADKPLHFFGPIGGSLFLIGFIISLYLSIERVFFGVLLYRRPALQFGILLIIVGIQIIMTGVIGELIVYLNKKNQK